MKDFFKSILLEIKTFYRNIKRIISWFPVIWSDRDYDYTFTYEILKKKLQTQKKYFIELNGQHHTKDVKDLDIAINLIDKLIGEHYIDEWYDYVSKDFKFIEKEDNNDLYTIQTEYKWERLDEYINKNLGSLRRMKKIYSIKTDYFDSDELSIDEKESIAMDIGRYKHEKCKRIFFNFLHDKIETWWY